MYTIMESNEACNEVEARNQHIYTHELFKSKVLRLPNEYNDDDDRIKEYEKAIP